MANFAHTLLVAQEQGRPMLVHMHFRLLHGRGGGGSALQLEEEVRGKEKGFKCRQGGQSGAGRFFGDSEFIIWDYLGGTRAELLAAQN